MAKIMFIRHAEKPVGKTQGVNPSGTDDKEDLIVQGWQRAGALVRLFAPVDPTNITAGLAKPTALFAADAASASSSLRPEHTVLPLSQLLTLTIDTSIAKKDHKKIADAAAAAAANGPVLVAWQHDEIPKIVNHVMKAKTVPQKWPGDRFDMVWVLDQVPGTSGWTFSQVPQMLLAGDSTTPIT